METTKLNNHFIRVRKGTAWQPSRFWSCEVIHKSDLQARLDGGWIIHPDQTIIEGDLPDDTGR